MLLFLRRLFFNYRFSYQTIGRIKAVVFDFDGVMTDNKVFVSQDGKEWVACNRSDGMGLKQLLQSQIAVLVLSTEENPVVSARCNKLKLPCLQGIQNKIATLTQWAKERGIALDSIVYVGNDVNDLDCLRAVGFGVAVDDAWPAAKAAAKFVLPFRGGQGAVRALCDLIVEPLASTKK